MAKRMGLLSRIAQEREEMGIEVWDGFQPERKYVPGDDAIYAPRPGDRPLEVVCSVCGAEPDRPCTKVSTGLLMPISVHHHRVVAWRQAEKAAEEARQYEEPSWVVNGRRLSKSDMEAVQCPHCAAPTGKPCKSPKAVLGSYHAKRQQRAYEHAEGE